MQQEPKKIERIFFTFLEAQEFLGVSHQTIYKLMKEGLPSHKIDKKRVLRLVQLKKNQFLGLFHPVFLRFSSVHILCGSSLRFLMVVSIIDSLESN